MLLYGGNGSGKTTIGKAINQIANGGNDFRIASFKNSANKDIVLTEEDKKNIFVFNDEFVNKKLKFENDSKLRAVVLIGESIKQQEDLISLEKQIKNNDLSISNINIQKYESNNSFESPKYYKEKIINYLKDKWANDVNKIKLSKPYVTDDVFKKILNTVKKDEFDEKEYEKQINLFVKSNNSLSKIVNDLKIPQNLIVNMNRIKCLLSMRFDRPVGEEIIERISNTVAKQSYGILDEIKHSFSSGYCPYCFRDISKEQVTKIIKAINIAQDKTIDNHIKELKNLILQDCDINTQEFKELDISSCSNIDGLQKKLNEKIKLTNSLIQEKINNPYDAIKTDNISIDDTINELQRNINQLLKLRDDFNTQIDNKDNFREKVLLLVDLKARFDNNQLFEQYERCTINYNNDSIQKEAYKKNNEEKKLKIKQINENKKNLGDGLNIINAYLKKIFLSDSRLKIVLDGDNYVVKVFDKTVSTEHLSSGEKNAIALSYFFLSINEDAYSNKLYTKTVLVVLDDPLSSFDNDNTEGICCFLEGVLKDITLNKQSIILLLTHQMGTFIEMNRFFIKKKNKNKDKNQAKSLILSKKTIQEFDDDFNIYKKYIVEITNFVENYSSNDKIQFDTERFGSKLRKVLEAFASFNYDCSFSDLIMEKLNSNDDDRKIKTYYNNSLLRNTLNESCHFYNRTQKMSETDLIESINDKTIFKCCLDGLTLINYFSDKHLQSMLDSNDSSIFDMIKKNLRDMLEV